MVWEAYSMRKRMLVGLLGILLLPLFSGCGSDDSGKIQEGVVPKGRIRRSPAAEEAAKKANLKKD
jgi:hypothetical protein